MKDQYGRKIDYLRVSVTDRCNLRCVYCMPKEGVPSARHCDILTYDEITRICRICAEEGISRIKLTGGEPLVRRNLDVLVGSLKDIPGIEEVTLTTNGVYLKDQLESLQKAGLDGVNISLDTLDRAQYEKLTGGDHLKEVLEGLEAALEVAHWKVKLNCAAIGTQNQDQYAALAALAKEQKLDVRFIEMMPIGLGKQYAGNTQDEMIAMLEEAFGPSRQLEGRFGNGPAVYRQFEGFAGKIGFISAMSHNFCHLCNRVRLTSEGFLKACLQYQEGADLRRLLREEQASDERLKTVIRDVIVRKPRQHSFTEGEIQQHMEDEDKHLETRRMSQIGG